MTIFDPRVHIQTITIVGIGGTGAQIARSVARIVFDMRQARMQIPKIVLIDPDKVELKNVGRQLFTEADIGQNKAYIMMRRLNMALGLDITAIDRPVDKSNIGDGWNTLVIGAVDNHLARIEIAENSRLWIDAGNHKAAGQVVIGNSGSIASIKHEIKQSNGSSYNYMPNAALLFPGLLEPEPPAPEPAPDASCADLVATREQDLLINDWLSVVTSQYTYKLLHRQLINTFITFVGADDLVVRSVPITKENIESYLRLDEEKAG
jgi:PRTRC genetic system ThiF family protein